MALSPTKIAKLTTPGRYPDERSLYLFVRSATSKAWVQRLTINGKRRDLGLGPWPEVSLQKAREVAFANRQAVANGMDPLAERVRPKVPTFRIAAEQFFDEVKKPTLKDCRSTRQWLQMVVKYAFPVIGDLQVDQIRQQDIVGLVKPVWLTKPVTGRHLRQRLRMILQWCIANQFVTMNCAGEVIDAAFPSRRIEPKNLRALPYTAIPEAYHRIQDYDTSPSTALCLQFLILTAVRQSEARGARWEEIDWDQKLWTIPNARMKKWKGHRVPLSDEALAVLEQSKTLLQSKEWVFPSRQTGRPMCESTLTKLLGVLGLHDHTVPHGFRSSFRTWAAEYADADFVSSEMALAHKVGTTIERIYSRTDLLEKRRRLMQLWADYVTGKHEPAKVIPLAVHR